jgi:hypothetical protein
MPHPSRAIYPRAAEIQANPAGKANLVGILFYLRIAWRWRVVIELGKVKDCDECKDPTKKKAGTAYDLPGAAGVCSPVWDCDNERCKRKQAAHVGYLLRSIHNGKEEALK